ncbi:hypothetical protein T06_4321, partial [Trichinella sp. T6]
LMVFDQRLILMVCFYKRQSLINLICDILNGDECEVRFHPNQLRSNTELQPEHLSLLIPELKGNRHWNI